MLAPGCVGVRHHVPSHGKGYCVRSGALIQSLYLRGCINWLQMAHMVLIKDYLAAAGSGVCAYVCECCAVHACVQIQATWRHVCVYEIEKHISVYTERLRF